MAIWNLSARDMAEDEAATIRMLTDYREEIAMRVRQHRGRVVDSPGDNVLAEFPTALEAVRSALEIQGVLRALNASLSAERRMDFRIGVHMGDVARVISVGRDRTTGQAVLRFRDERNRIVAVRLRPRQFRTLANGVLGLAEAEE